MRNGNSGTVFELSSSGKKSTMLSSQKGQERLGSRSDVNDDGGSADYIMKRDNENSTSIPREGKVHIMTTYMVQSEDIEKGRNNEEDDWNYNSNNTGANRVMIQGRGKLSDY